MMEWLRLAVAVLLPWLGGYLWLAVAEQRWNRQAPNRLRQLGYGLFVGYAGLQGIVLASNASTGEIELWRINTVLVLLTVAAGLLLLRGRLAADRAGESLPAGPADIEDQSSPFLKYLYWLLVAWAGLHLIAVAIEIIHRPVFPWDAWLNWMYRAKAWFHAGNILEMDHPQDWLLGTGTALYNVAGNHYPTFSPVLALWAATALGHWSETLVNMPVLLCGVALGLALYGQAREYGLPKWLAALAAYLLLSIPLAGTHLALAGQADIWMAGFTGLGFIALLRGCIQEERYQLLLGLAMTAMGMAVKAEGAVWFLAALLAVSLSIWPRRTGIGLAVVAGVIVAALLFGLTHLELPLLGEIGVENGRLHLPFLGSYTLQSFALWDDYAENFFRNGTWHLLWTFLLLFAIALCFLPAGRLRSSLASFIAVVLAAQLLIFMGTEQGQWAEDWTAINRLPLQFSPLLVFSLAISLHALLGQRNMVLPIRPGLLFPLVGLGIVVAGAAVYLLTAYAGDSGKPRVFTPADMRVIAGTAPLKDDTRRIVSYQESVALLSSGPVDIDAGEYGLLRVSTAGPNPNHATFFWRSGQGEPGLHTLEISGRGTRWIDLAGSGDWTGKVSEIGIIFYGYGGEPLDFHGMELRPYALSSLLGKVIHDWSEISYWSQTSAHWLPAGAQTTTIPLPLLMSAWVLITVILTVLIDRHNPATVAGALLCALVAWLILDLRWTANSIAQAARTIESYPVATATALKFGDDEKTSRLVRRAQPTIAETYKRTVVAAEDPTMRFQTLRAKYHALPASAWVHEGPLDQAPARIGDYLLVLRKWHREPGYEPVSSRDYARKLSAQTGLHIQPVFDEPEGFLLEVVRTPVQTDRGDQ